MNRVTSVIAALLFSAWTVDSWSQGAPYPAKLVRIINPVAPGGNQDTVARAYAEQFTKALGQPVVVESRPGASALVGTRYVKGSPPDGYTLLSVSNTFVRVPAIVEIGSDSNFLYRSHAVLATAQ